MAAPTDAALQALCAREHAACFACRPVAAGGLGLCFRVAAHCGHPVGRHVVWSAQ